MRLFSSIQFTKFTKIQLTIFAFFSVFYALLSIINHLNFRTNWFDLGFYTHHIFEYSTFNFSSLKNNLSDHFDLFLVLISPLRFLFGEYTLLIVQIAFVLLGGYGFYLLALKILKNETKAILIQLTFLLCFAVISSIGFDYHSNVVAVCLSPFLIYFYLCENKQKLLITWLIIIISKENMILNVSFLLALLPFILKKPNQLKFFAIALGGISFILFLLIVGYVMPRLSSTEVYFNFKYTSVGGSKSFKDLFIFLLSHPLKSIELMFTNTSGNSLYDYYKTEAHIFIFLCGGFVFLLRPLLLLAAAPIYLQKFLHDSENIWGLSYQYNIDFLPLILLGVCMIASRTTFNYFVHLVLILNITLTIRMMDKTVSFVKKSSIRIYQGIHYQSDIDKNEFKQALNFIPKNASVMAHSYFTPHLCMRDSIFMFNGFTRKTDFILVSDTAIPYPLKGEHYLNEIEKIKLSNEYDLVYDKPKVKLFKRK